MRYVEEAGFGMDVLKSLQSTYKLPLPEYAYQEPFLTLTFPRSMEAVKKVSQYGNIGKLTEEELKGYEWIKSQDGISTKEYAAQFKYTQRTASRHITNMLKLKLLKDNGESSKSPKLRYLPK
jgi:ATP-dependent DNA helicase RecG